MTVRGMNKILAVTLASILALTRVGAMAQQSAVHQACGTEIERHCAGLQPGGGRIQACMKDHFAEYSEPCRQAIITAKFGKR